MSDLTGERTEELRGHPLIDNPLGEHNYLPAELTGKLGLKIVSLPGIGIKVLEMPDYKIVGRSGKLTGRMIYIPVAREWNNLSKWLTSKGQSVEDGGECQEAGKIEKFNRARLAGLPVFLATHYAFSYLGELEFGSRYRGVKHVIVRGQPESGKSPSALKIAEIPGVERWSLETKYPPVEVSGGDFGEISTEHHAKKDEYRKMAVDERKTTVELLDELLMNMAEKSRLDDGVFVCVWDAAGFPRYESDDKKGSFNRPTDPLDLIEVAGVWDKIFLLTRSLTSQMEQERLKYFSDLLSKLGEEAEIERRAKL